MQLNLDLHEVVLCSVIVNKLGVIEEAGLIMESAPPCSVVLSGKRGRLPVATKLHYPAQPSTVPVAHKTADFICNGGGGLYGGRHAQTRSKTTTTLEPPRQQMLEDAGVVLSAKHPTDGTNVTIEMAHHLLCRQLTRDMKVKLASCFFLFERPLYLFA